MTIAADCYLPGTVRVGDGDIALERDGERIPLSDPASVLEDDLDGQRVTVGVDLGHVLEARGIDEDGESGVRATEAGIALCGTTKRHKSAMYPFQDRRSGATNRTDRYLAPGVVVGGFPASATEGVDGYWTAVTVDELVVVEVLAGEYDPYRTDPFADVAFDLYLEPGARDALGDDDWPCPVRLGAGAAPLYDGPGWAREGSREVLASVARELTDGSEHLVGDHRYLLDVDRDEGTLRIGLDAAPVDFGVFPHDGIALDREAFLAAFAESAMRFVRATGASPTMDGDEDSFAEQVATLADAAGASLDRPEAVALAVETEPVGEVPRPEGLTDEELLDRLVELAADPAHRVAAIAAVEAIDGEASAERLVALLEEHDWEAADRWLLADALERIDARAAERGLENLAANDPSRAIRAKASRELADGFGTDVQIVEDADEPFDYRDWQERLHAAAAETRLAAIEQANEVLASEDDDADIVVDRGFDRPAVDILEPIVECFADDEDASVRAAAGDVLGDADAERVASCLDPDRVRVALDDDAALVRSYAADLARLVSPAPTGALIDALGDSEPDHRPVGERAGEALAEIASRNADGAVGELERETFVDRLAAAIESGAPVAGYHPFEALEAVDPATAARVVRRVLESEQPGPCFDAARNRLKTVDADPEWLTRTACRALAVEGDGGELTLARILEGHIDTVPIDAIRRAAIEADSHTGSQAPVDILVLIATARTDYRGQNPPFAIQEHAHERTAAPSAGRAQAARQALVDAVVEGENHWAVRALPVVLDGEPPEILLNVARGEVAPGVRTTAFRPLADTLDVSADLPETPGFQALATAGGDADPSVRTSAWHVLWSLLCKTGSDGDPAVVELMRHPDVEALLERGLTDSESEVREQALRIVADVGWPTVDQLEIVRRRALEDDARVRKRAIEALGAALGGAGRDEAATRETLQEVAREDPDPDFRERAVEALLAESTDRMLSVLAEVATADPAAAVRTTAVTAIAEQYLDGPHRETAIDALERVLTADDDPAVRAAAVETLLAASDRAAERAVEVAATDTARAVREPVLAEGQPGSRLAARVADGRRPDPEAPLDLRKRELAAALADDPEAGLAAIRATTRDDPAAHLRIAALQELVEREAPTRERLEQAASDDAPRVRKAAIDLLAAEGRTDVLETVASDDPRADVRTRARAVLDRDG